MRSRRARGAPVQFEACIDSLNDDGRGVARVDGKVTFVSGALPGERVRAEIESTRRSHDGARTIEVLHPSPERVEPGCAHFGVCGGCSLQHMHPQAQIRAKQEILRERFERFGGLAPAAWMEPLTGPDAHYRRSARLGVRDVPKKGGVLVGFRERRSSYITPLAGCLVLDERIADLLPELAALVEGLSCKQRLPQIEAACGDEDAALVFRHLVPLEASDRERLAAFGRRHAVRIYLQPGGPESVIPLEPPDPGPLTYAQPVFDVTLAFEPTDFIQVNATINRAMVEQAVRLLGAGPADTVLDLFCGLGNFTLPIARSAGRVIGFESDARLLDAARANARRNGIGNAEFRRADLYDEAEARAVWSVPAERALLDPPRSGAIEVLKVLPARGPSRIVYVSCNPATLARDAEYLVNARGYRLERAGVLDMFPQTSHVESIAVFEKRS